MKMRDLAELAPWAWPQTASVSILEVLQDPAASWEERELAVELAGNLVVMNDDLARELLGILDNPSEPVDLRSRSAIAFGAALEDSETADEEAFNEWDTAALTEPVLHRIKEALGKAFQNLEHAKGLRRMALEASVRSPEPWHFDAVRTAYEGEDPELDRGTIIASMHAAAVIRPDKAEDVLSEFFDSDGEDLAQAALEAFEVARLFILGEDEEPEVWH